MGLDQYLYARKYVSNWSFDTPAEKEEYANVVKVLDLDIDDISPDSPAIYVDVPVLYWRKANQIHRWFVNEIQNGDDNCNRHYVDRNDLKRLLALCEQVETSNSEEVSAELLPAGEGFFFGNYEYGEWYYEQVSTTARDLRKILDNQKLLGYDFYYDSSW